jgi:hypothetical protein
MSNVRYHGATGATVYLVVWKNDQAYKQTGAALENYSGAHWTASFYCIAATEVGAGRYHATAPTTLAAGWYTLDWRTQAGADPAVGDASAPVPQYFDGTNWGGEAAQILPGLVTNLANLDAAISTRAAPAAKMDWVDAPNATAMAVVRDGLRSGPIANENGGVGVI